MRHYLSIVAPVALLALYAGGAMAIKDTSVPGVRPAVGSEGAATEPNGMRRMGVAGSSADAHGAAPQVLPPIDAAQPQHFATATFAFG